MEDVVKGCSACGAVKPLSGFHKDKYNADGHTGACKTCRTRATKKWNDENPERYKENCRSWVKRNPERVAYHSRKQHVKYTYGLTIDEYNKLIESGRCQLCGWEFDSAPGVDHCHETGEVRGVLCVRCNSGLGMFHDDEELLMLAIDYLMDPPARRVLGYKAGRLIDNGD